MPDKMSSQDFLGWIRESNGTGIGNVAGSPIGLQVKLGVGDYWFALDAEPERVRAAFESSFIILGGWYEVLSRNRERGPGNAYAASRKMMQTLVPPNPELFDSAAWMGRS